MSDNSTESTFDKLLNFNIDEKVLCFHGPLIYEAKVRFDTLIVEKKEKCQRAMR